MVTFIFFKSPSSSGDEVRNMQAALNKRQRSKMFCCGIIKQNQESECGSVSSVCSGLFCLSQLVSAPRHPPSALSLLLPRLAPSVPGTFALLLLIPVHLLVHVPQGFCLLSLLRDTNDVCLFKLTFRYHVFHVYNFSIQYMTVRENYTQFFNSLQLSLILSILSISMINYVTLDHIWSLLSFTRSSAFRGNW